MIFIDYIGNYYIILLLIGTGENLESIYSVQLWCSRNVFCIMFYKIESAFHIVGSGGGGFCMGCGCMDNPMREVINLTKMVVMKFTKIQILAFITDNFYRQYIEISDIIIFLSIRVGKCRL